jgi:CubicO group peptidase (beta-lactamase class C family)
MTRRLSMTTRRELTEAVGERGRRSALNEKREILADVVAQVTRKDFPSVADEHIFGPLSMKQSFFETVRSRVVEKRATAYAPDLLRPGNYLSKLKNFDVVGDVGLMTSVDDLIVLFCQLHAPKDAISRPIASLLMKGTSQFER